MRRFWGVDSNGFERGAAEVARSLPFGNIGGVVDEVSDVLLRALLAARVSKSILGSSMGAGADVCRLPLEDADLVIGRVRVDVDGSGEVCRWGLEYGASELGT